MVSCALCVLVFFVLPAAGVGAGRERGQEGDDPQGASEGHSRREGSGGTAGVLLHL